MDKERYILSPDCIPVKGLRYSMIYDIGRNKPIPIPNSLFDILDEDKGFSFGKLIEQYPLDIDIIKDYLKYLIENECVLTYSSNYFSEISNVFETPLLINNIIIDIDRCSIHNFEIITREVEEIGAYSLLLRYYFADNLENIKKTLSHFDDSRLRDIVLMIPFEDIDRNILKYLLLKFPRLSMIIVHSANKLSISHYNGKSIRYIKNKYSDETCCGNINKTNFRVNKDFFFESKLYNNCLYKKLSIDKNGEVKNCPSSDFSYGNINNIHLKDVLKIKHFSKLWSINKDSIEDCKDCEYRYMCLDCRIYISDKNNIYSKPLKCNYNVSTGIWQKK